VIVVVVVVAGAWAGLVAGAGWRHRPAPARARALIRRHARADRHLAHRPLPTERLGRWVLARLGRRPDPLAARRAGAALVAAAAVAPLVPLGVPAAALLGWTLPGLRCRRDQRRRLAALVADLPDVVDLFVLAVGAGLTVPQAVVAVSARASGPLGAELARACEEVRLGRRVAEALEDVIARAGEPVRPLVAALVASERYGAPLGAGLERLADEVRRQRRHRAEEVARRVPVKLLFPLVCCTLPALALLTVAPLVASAVRSLRL